MIGTVNRHGARSHAMLDEAVSFEGRGRALDRLPQIARPGGRACSAALDEGPMDIHR
jgi:hypothetical protein